MLRLNTERREIRKDAHLLEKGHSRVGSKTKARAHNLLNWKLDGGGINENGTERLIDGV